MANVLVSQWTLNQSLSFSSHNWYVVANNGCGSPPGPTWSFTIQAGDPNDQIGEAVSLGYTTQTTNIDGNISSPSDVNMYSFSVLAGQRISFDIDLPSGSSLDSYIRLFNSSGTQLAANNDAAGPGESSSGGASYLEYTFTTSGTYYIGVSGYGNTSYDPITGSGDGNGSTGAYKLIVSPGITGTIIGDIGTGRGTETYVVDILRLPPTGSVYPRPITNTLRTWIVIHGMNSSRNTTDGPNFPRLAQAIANKFPNEQVLTLDWSGPAHTYAPADFHEEDWIEPVASWAAATLSAYGFNGNSLNLVGHSWGGSMTDEIAKRIPGGVNTIVALDPARDGGGFPSGGVYDPELYFGLPSAQIDFARDSQFSWAFHSSSLGSASTPTTADEAFVVQTGLFVTDAHPAVVNLFSYMVENPTIGVCQFFQLDRLLNHTPGPWVPNTRFTEFPFPENRTGGYEGIITATPGSTVSVISPQSPLDFVPTTPEINVLGNSVAIADNDTTPSLSDNTDFGSVQQGQTATRTFTVRNDGGSSLTLGAVNVPSGFTLTKSLPTFLIAGDSDTFTVQLNTSTIGTKSGQINFSNNDSDENPFNFSITGSVTALPDTTPPALTIGSPVNGAVVTSASLPVSGTASDSGLGNNGISSVTVNGVSATGGTASGTGTANWNTTLTLVSGVNTITVVAKDALNNSTQKVVSVTYNPPDTTAPALTIGSPVNGAVVTSASLPFSGTASDNGLGNNGISSVTVNGISASGGTASGTGTASWNTTVTLVSGVNTITVVAKDTLNNTTQKVVSVTYNPPETTPPALTIASPLNGAVVTSASLPVSGTASDNGLGNNGISSVTVNGINASGGTASGTGTASWNTTITLVSGVNTITVVAKDTLNNTTQKVVSVTYNPPDTSPPALTITSPLNGAVVTSASLPVNGTASDNGLGNNGISSVTVNGINAGGGTASGTGTASWNTTITLVSGVNTITVVAKDMLNNSTQKVVSVTYNPPPDTTPPTISITTPTSGQRWSNAVFTVTGTAHDNVQVANVYYQLNGAGWNSAVTGNSWSNWTAAVNLAPGTNFVQACAVDVVGNPSTTNNMSFDYVVANKLQIRAIGLGAISPNYSNSWLEIGRNYSITSSPASGFVATNWMVSTNWLGGFTTNNRVVRFMMASNLTLQVNFADVTKPTLTVTAPTAGQKMTNALAKLTGTASDNWKVTGVWYQLNSNAWNLAATANNFANWTNTVTLITGTNTLKFYALDLGGNYSATNSLSIVSSNTFMLQLAFTNALPMKTNGLVFSLQLSKGLNGIIQFSSNLTSWTTLTNFVGTNNTLNFRDPAATNSPRRFYRAVIP
jgi:pimeloyl-ACP methyl ester carboxylesterase